MTYENFRARGVRPTRLVLSALLVTSLVAPSFAGDIAFGPLEELTTPSALPWQVSAGDLDGDGDLDIAAALTGDGLFWYRNLDGRGTFSSATLLTTNWTLGVEAADMDGDGDLDLATIEANRLAWYENSGAGTFTTVHVIGPLSSSCVEHRTFDAADVDGDGDVDVVFAGECTFVGWSENLGNLGFAPLEVIAFSPFDIVYEYVIASDVDGDGDLDALWTDSGQGLVFLARFTGGGFGAAQVIATLPTAAGLTTADVDGDGDVDVAVTSFFSGTMWIENTDGFGAFGPPQEIEPLGGGFSIDAKDLDGDGDIDLVHVNGNQGILRWSENLDGLGTFGTSIEIDDDPMLAFDTELADVNADGRVDIVLAAGFNIQVAWFENLGLQAEPLVSLGAALAGAAGEPLLVAEACLSAGGPYTFTLTNARSDTTSAFVVGLSDLSAPFKGGTLVPSLDLVIAGLPTGPGGTIVLDGTFSGGIPAGFDLYFQHWIVDPAGPAGFAASNAVTGQTE